MKKNLKVRISGLLSFTAFLALALALAGLPCCVGEVNAESDTISPYDVIAEVNVLRASYGLPPLEIDSTLMSIAQSHSQYQAAVGNWTHNSADGTNPQGRAEAAGYGSGATIIVSENVAEVWSGQNFTVSDVIYDLWSDSVHWNTMINPQYIHAGAGVAEKDGIQFITLDVGYIAGVSPASTAQPLETAAAAAQAPVTTATSAAAGASATATSYADVIMPVQASTPLPDGSIYHVVQPGQVLLTIAQMYGVEVNDVAALNDVSPDSIYVGDKLLIRMPFTPTIALPSDTPAPCTPTPEWTAKVGAILATNQAMTVTATPEPQKKPPTIPIGRSNMAIIVTVVVGLLALLGLNYIHTK